MNVLQIFLFGKFQAQCGESVLTGLEAHKVQELFCYLLLYRDHPHARETLADLLWGETYTAQSKSYLRKALWQLQAALDTHLEPANSRLLWVEPDWVQINSEVDLWLDVAEFEQAFKLVQGLSGREIDGGCVQALLKATNLYRGDLLEGWYQNWCLYERERLQHLYLAMLDKLMDYYEAHHDYEAGITHGTRILSYDRAREHTHRRLMRLHYLAGDRTAALRQYERCAQALEEELGVKPARHTVALYEQLRADHLDELSPALAEAKPAPPATTASLSEVLEHLKHLQASLSDLYSQVRQDIEAVELAINRRR